MLTIVAEPDASGGFTTSVVEMPGCHSEGDTLEDALQNTAEAIRGWAAVKAAESSRGVTSLS